MPETVIATLEETARRLPDRPALRWKQDGEWATATWGEYRERVLATATGLVAAGLRPGRGVVILSPNRPEWFLGALGAIAAGGVPSGIYTNSTPEQCAYITDHCEAQVALVHGEEGLELFARLRERLPGLETVVSIGEPAHGSLAWDELQRAGGPEDATELRRRIEAPRPADLATLIYTSGTTGNPKAVMISHHNLVWTAARVAEAFELTAGESVLCYLPLSHVAEQIVSLHTPLAAGGTTWFAESLEKVPENLREVRPHFFFAVPRVWEKMQARIAAAAATAPPLRRRLLGWSRRVGMAAGMAEQEGRRPPLALPLARRLVHGKVRARLGLDRASICSTSAAPIARHTLDFFLGLGIPVLEVYGMSECTGPTTFSLPGRYRTGAAGFAIPGTELATAADGEILMRGPHVCLGYFKEPQATAETIDAEGWLRSGDVGRIDADGFLWVTDRKKELLVTSGGKNVAPAPIEARLKGILGIGQAVVVGDRRHYVAALLFLDPDGLAAAAVAAGSPATEPEEGARCSRLRAWLERRIEEVNQGLARYESVRRFAVLPRPLTLEGGELTPSLKLKRRVVAERYAAEIDELYREGAA